jgi:hypothetical protein
VSALAACRRRAPPVAVALGRRHRSPRAQTDSGVPLASLASIPALPVQPRLEVGPVADRHEREADGIAARVMSTAARPAVQRAAEPAAAGGETMAASDGELTSGGAPLPAATRGFFEKRMGRDLAGVRVHEGAGASALSASIGARAFTYRDHIWLGGRERAAPSFTMAHELAHVMQQTAPGAVGTAAVQREPEGGGMGDFRIAEGQAADKAAEEEARKGQTEGANMAGRALTDADIAAIQAGVPGSASPARITPTVHGANFVLHDTGSLSSVAHLKEVAGKGRRSSGAGAGVYAPQSGSEIVAHQPFYGPRRPTATEWEKGNDVMGKAAREKALRAVWKAAARDVRESAIENALVKQGSPPKEVKKELKAAIKELNAKKGDIHSAATWGIQDLCDQVTPQTVATLAKSAATEADLLAGCQGLAGLFITREGRIGKTANIEIAQEAGSACRTTTKKGPLVPLTPYSADQFKAVRDVYLKAALEARVFPTITTHFLVDKVAGDHCDPRCFDLGRLYADIQTLLGHVAGSSYGIAPIYGTGGGDNVWWNDTVCGGGHP